MKKFSVILLIAVLAMTSVFADPITIDAAISGSATAEYDIYLDASNDPLNTIGSFGYTAPDTTGFDIDLTLTGAAGKKDHATDLWAEMAATVKYTTVAGVDEGAIDATSFKFVIHKDGKWDWDLTKAAKVANFAKSFDIVYDGTKAAGATKATPTASLDNNTEITGNGTTFTWNGFTFAAAVNGGVTRAADQDYYFGVKTPDFTIGTTGIKVQGAGAISYKYTPDFEGEQSATAKENVFVPIDDSEEDVEAGLASAVYTTAHAIGDQYFIIEDGDLLEVKLVESYHPSIKKASTEADLWDIEGSLKIAYANDDASIKVSAATDQKISFSVVDYEAVKYDVDALVNMTFKPVDIDIYFANTASAKTADKKSTRIVTNLLSAKASADLSEVAPITISVKGLNLLNASRILSAEVKYTFVADKFDITAYALDLLNSEAQAENWAPADRYYLGANYEGQKVGVKSTLTFGDVKIVPEVFYRIAVKEFCAKTDVTYTNPNFTVTAGVMGDVVLGSVDNKCFKLNAGIKSTTLVENATLSFNYATNNLLKDMEYADPLAVFKKTEFKCAAPTPVDFGAGSVSLSCTVEF